MLGKTEAGGERDDRRWDVGWHHWHNGHESEQTPGDGKGQGSLVCGSPWGCKELDITEWLNSNISSNFGSYSIGRQIRYLLLLNLGEFI